MWMPRILGIDVGLGGALAVLAFATEQVLDIVLMPTIRIGKLKRSLNITALANAIDELVPDHVVIEQQWARPGQGVMSSFRLGQSFGTTIGIVACLGLPFETVAPAVWKRRLEVPSDAHSILARANQLMPGHDSLWPRPAHHDRAEAALIALWKIRSDKDGGHDKVALDSSPFDQAGNSRANRRSKSRTLREELQRRAAGLAGAKPPRRPDRSGA
jgi:hypothetical protein